MLPVFAEQQDSAPIQPMDVSNVKNAIPKPLPYSAHGNPTSYTVNGKTYHVLKTNVGYESEGFASWYGTKFQGKRTSSGEPYNMYSMTAASPVLPIPSFVEVTNLSNNKSVIVKVNDRGPFHEGRILDLSYAAASKLGMLQHGTAFVKVIAIDTGVPSTHETPHQFIQVATFANQANAMRMVAQLQPVLAEPVALSTKEKNDQQLYRVLIGPITRTQVATIQQTLMEHGFSKGITTTG